MYLRNEENIPYSKVFVASAELENSRLVLTIRVFEIHVTLTVRSRICMHWSVMMCVHVKSSELG